MRKHKDAVKRHRQSLEQRTRNRGARSALRTAVKKVRALVDGGDTSGAQDALKLALPIIGKVSSKGAIHKRTASRLISRLTRAVNRV